MNAHTLAAVERAADVSLKILAALNLLFLAAFAATLLFGVSQARAQGAPVACTGEDLLAQLQRDDPAKLAEIRAEAAGVANGKGLLWRIEKDGAAPSYLFGTMHLSDPRVVALGPQAQEAFDASSTVVIETTEVLDPARMMAAMLANPELTMFTDGTTLMSLVPEEERATVEAALSERGIPPASVAKMKPWMISAMVALPACEMARKASGAPVLDMRLAHDGEADGKALGGLETIADQLGAMASLPMEFHIRGLVDTLKLGDAIDDVIETMIVLYLGEETGMFWPFFRAALPAGEEGDAGFSAFEETMVTARNRTMAERAVPFIDAGAAFIAVGALHLPGEEGVIALLREKGYRIEAIR
ncbi:MAG: TraB/GumN family protein [Aquamicrobium sp.]|nr:TraB/GumN family protein [Aquamicrobium sp.]